MARGFSRKFYKSKLWQQQREYILKRDKYLCQRCGNPAEEIHHIIHLSPENITDPLIALHESNLISLCTDCHFKVHGSERKEDASDEFIFDENGYLVPKKKDTI